VGSWYSVIVGSDACLATPATCTLAGGVVEDDAARTVTIHLKHPSGEFLQQLSMPFASILPSETPPRDLGTTPPVATGPYMVTSYEPTRRMRIARNPYFHEWNPDAQPDGYVDAMEYRYGLQDEAEVTAIENGQQDWMYDEKPLDRLQEIGSRYTWLAHIHPMLAYYYVTMNVHEKPFDDVRVRRAVAMAVNRRAAVNLFGGPALATPLCQLLPAGMPGYVPYCPFSKPPGPRWVAPDLEQARALVRASGTAGMRVTFISSDKQVERTIGIYMQSVLQDLGYDAGVHAVSFNIRDPYMENSNNHYQIGLTDWYQDYPSPSDFLQVMYSCRTIHPGSDASINMSQFCDPALEARMDQAAMLAATDRDAANRLWAGIDHDMTDLAPGTTLFQINFLDLVSPRLGNYKFSTLYHMLLSQAWVH
jgi:peptide/nickel transport system substrate-binding protein